ncbi:NAD(P)(+)--arginine ADP-ribosyltransferase 2-like [Pangasianodon hypophthalmus]|uniref:NAD(P)(+)--arginine ADP-ribosyltransferase 2-like n=1 Tax=Pangasianodon hypophthalmus TaxID=310915 RepID=UPI0023078A8D|nr:NAD(P)(+)--arginine ADP-ribosyltransferase 2-like [Pangasianodon hypophthalmus]XP_053094861.1 NAD(P)(+)--arginine ADP-ribosyltransferase 2-like [Pangasianodon hypophthalmus]XP_053094862.1 NAD(P)(+)--arginine ADP-ribosyltransferase 2-like [Pangasianodon hypophthalmus]
MNTAVKVSTFAKNVATAVIIISVVCYAENLKWISDSVIRLDMAENSVDDQFIGCRDTMYKLITKKILPEELKCNKNFKNIWEKYSKFTDYFTRIIKVYTDGDSKLYSQFNEAVSSGRRNYVSKFTYKAFHFLLTRAVQIHQVKNCTRVFRRTNVHFDTNVLGREMRFGRFASTSLRTNMSPTFGKTSCFKVTTCFGANIAKISVFPKEEEVLVPPFEKFKITKIEKNQMNCSVIYTLQSTGRFSKMNCALLK